MAQYIFGIKVYLDAVFTEDQSIGLFTESGKSYIRLITNYVPTTLRYKEHFLIGQNPIGDASASADFRRSGNPSIVDGTEFYIDNTTSFFSTIKNIGLSLNGLICEVIRFDASSNPATETIEFRGICQAPEWTETFYKVAVQSNQYKRQANIVTEIDLTSFPYADQSDIGKIVPASFGQIDKVNGLVSPAKIIRTKDQTDILTFGNGLTGQVFANAGSVAPWDSLTLISDLTNITSLPVMASSGTGGAIINYALRIGYGQALIYNYVVGSAVGLPKVNNIIYAGSPAHGAGVLTFIDNVHHTLYIKTLWGEIRNGDIMYQPTPLPAFQITVSTRVAPVYPTSLSPTFWKGSNGLLLTTNEGGAGVTVLHFLIGKYLHCIGGDGQNEYKQITSAWIDFRYDSSWIGLAVADVFIKPLANNLYGTAVNQSWCQIETISKNYLSDIFPGKDFLDTNGVSATDRIALYNYDSKKTTTIPAVSIASVPATIPERIITTQETVPDFIQLPDLALARIEDGKKNGIYSVSKHFDSKDTISSFIVLPVKNFKFADNSIVVESGFNSTYFGFNLYPYAKPNGIWLNFADSPNHYAISYTQVPTAAQLADIINPSNNNTCNLNYRPWSSYGTNPIYVANVITFELPELPVNFEFDKIFLIAGLEAYLQIPGTPKCILNFDVYSRPFLGGGKKEFGVSNVGGSIWGVLMNDIPSFFFVPEIAMNYNVKFYQTNIAMPNWNGFLNFELSSLENINYYKSIQQLAVFLNYEITFTGSDSYCDMVTKFYKFGIAFQKICTIKDYLFACLQGRIFNDTWGLRKTATDLIQNPVDLLEHILRLQNWSEVGATETPGKAYGTGALINVGVTEGGFDYRGLGHLFDITIAGQISEYDSGWTQNIIQKICQQFFLCNYQDVDGKECVSPIFSLDDVSALPTIDLYNIVGEIGQVEDQKPEDVFCEPFVQYGKNYGSDKFDGIISISHSSAPAFDPSYVEGYSGEDAEMMWKKCNALYKYYRQIENPPSDLTDLEFIRTQRDAKFVLNLWLEYMGAYTKEDGTVEIFPKRKVSFSVPYEIAQGWNVAKHFLLSLPFQTGNLAVQCLIEKITKGTGLKNNLITLDVIMFGLSDVVSYWVKDTFLHYGTVGWLDWKNTFLTKAEHPANENDIKNEF